MAGSEPLPGPPVQELDAGCSGSGRSKRPRTALQIDPLPVRKRPQGGMGMRILSLVVAGVLALSFTGSGSLAWASPSCPASGDAKAPAKRAEKPKATATNTAKAKASSPSKSGSKSADSSLGSAARRELLKSRAQGMKPTKGKAAALKGKPKAKS